MNCTPFVRHILTRGCSFSMAKMSPEDKLAAVQRYLNGKESSRTVAADFVISHRYLLTLANQYRNNGVEVFVRRYTNYTKAFTAPPTVNRFRTIATIWLSGGYYMIFCSSTVVIKLFIGCFIPINRLPNRFILGGN